MHEANLRGTYLQGANLKRCIDIEIANFGGAKYNNKTKFTDYFDPEKHGLIKENRSGSFESRSPNKLINNEEYIQTSLRLDLEGSSPKIKILQLREAVTQIKLSIGQRRGQAKFREKLLTAYDNCCAMTGCTVTAALEAAHIVPYQIEENYDVKNGLILRADIHTLFDLDLIRIYPEENPEKRKIELHTCLLNTSDYKNLNGNILRTPMKKDYLPEKHYLEWRHKNYKSLLGHLLIR
ncbi:HNH endonuclease [Coleofasciculus sp. FACHB-1120]|nr:HNH endonuclease [Coleofasciculus sp. FACHB-1120]